MLTMNPERSLVRIGCLPIAEVGELMVTGGR